MSIGDLCAAVASLGMPAIDLLEIDEWPVAHDHGLTVSVGMPDAGTIERGINDPRNHEGILAGFRTNIPKAAEAGVPTVITFFGNHVAGMRRHEAHRNSVACLRECARIAEDHGVNIVIEMLNSKVDHIGYIGDTTAWGVDIVEAVGSERVKLLYDVYHMQIMEGDVIRTIRDNHQYIGHYHTGGVPGRAEIDETQELFYPAIAREILATGYKGFFAHEFIPRGDDPIGSLAAAVELCDV
jgi:hydroxypyruvate isomerase